jgi:hypothetical protein
MSVLAKVRDPRHSVPLYHTRTLTPERLLKHLSAQPGLFKKVPPEFHRHLPMLLGSVLLDRARKLTCFRALSANIDFRAVGLKAFLGKLADEHLIVSQCVDHAMLNDVEPAQSRLLELHLIVDAFEYVSMPPRRRQNAALARRLGTDLGLEVYEEDYNTLDSLLEQPLAAEAVKVIFTEYVGAATTDAILARLDDLGLASSPSRRQILEARMNGPLGEPGEPLASSPGAGPDVAGAPTGAAASPRAEQKRDARRATMPAGPRREASRTPLTLAELAAQATTPVVAEPEVPSARELEEPDLLALEPAATGVRSPTDLPALLAAPQGSRRATKKTGKPARSPRNAATEDSVKSPAPPTPGGKSRSKAAGDKRAKPRGDAAPPSLPSPPPPSPPPPPPCTVQETADAYVYACGKRSISLPKFEQRHLLLMPETQVAFDAVLFMTLLKESISLTKEEKGRIIKTLPSLKQAQVDELLRIFDEEQRKFIELDGKHAEQTNKLRTQHRREWDELVRELWRSAL